jgi:MoxR-like ATPase
MKRMREILTAALLLLGSVAEVAGTVADAVVKISGPGGRCLMVGPFVGREEELKVPAAALDHACAGRGRLVLLTGEPGIGRTRTAEEAAARAERRGMRVLWGLCSEGEGAPQARRLT